MLLVGSAGCGTEHPVPPATEYPVAADWDVRGAWPTYGGQASGSQYSPLAQINVANVNDLQVAWTYHVGELSDGTDGVDLTAYQVTPIYANHRIYLCSPFNHIIALDPATGSELWRHDPDRKLTDTFYGANTCRGVSYWQASEPQERARRCGKRVFETLQNGILIAVDADTGDICPDFGDDGRVDLNALDYKGEGDIYSTSPPAIYRDVVVTGFSAYDNRYLDAVDGIVRGFDARTGKELWNWNPIPPALSDRTGGANTWAPISVDTERGWVFLPTTSPSIDKLGLNRTDPIPHANAVVALEAETGEQVWSYQTVHHDLWDYDLASMPTLVDVRHDGKVQPAVVQATKMGYLFVLNRDTGEPLFPVVETPVPQTDVPGEFSSPTQPIPTLPQPLTPVQTAADDAWGLLGFDTRSCRKRLQSLRNEGIYTPPSLRGSILYPSFIGGTNWGGVAVDERRGIAVANATNMATFVKFIPRDEYDLEAHTDDGHQHFDVPGSPYVIERGRLYSPLGLGAKRVPCNPPPWGTLTAVDLNTGETLWQIPFGKIGVIGPFDSLSKWGTPNQGGPVITAGGLIFIGASPDNYLRAFALETGEEVWAGDVPAPAVATPMTFEHGGRQLVVVAAGGRIDFETDLSDAIVAFALPL